MKKLILPLSIENLIKQLEKIDRYDSSTVMETIKKAEITEGDILMWSDFNHPKKEGYGRKLIYQSDQFEVMVMSWAPLDATSIHNHGHTTWGTVQTFGKLEHVVYSTDDNCISIAHKEVLESGEVVPVDSNLVHQMINLFDKNVLSLHVYGTNLKVKGITDDTLVFDIGKREVFKINGGAFYDIASSEKVVVDEDLHAERLAEISHYASLLRHYLKTGTKGPQYRQAVNYFQNRSFEGRLITELEMDSKGVLYMVELNRVKNLLTALNESTKTVDSILADIYNFERFS